MHREINWHSDMRKYWDEKIWNRGDTGHKKMLGPEGWKINTTGTWKQENNAKNMGTC